MNEQPLFQTESDNAVVVALDHGIANGNMEGFEHPQQTLQDVIRASPDGIIARAPFVERFQDILASSDTKVIIAPDVLTYSTLPGEDDGNDMWTGAFSGQFIREIDPTGVKVVLNFGREDYNLHRENIEYLVELYEELSKTDIALIVETVMWGKNVPDGYAQEMDHVKNAVRIGWELGADILKVPYTGEQKKFANMINQTPVPCMILGGPATTSKETLKEVEEAVQAGARGVMIGRSIWQTPDPTAMVQAMKRVVHKDVTASEAMP